LLADTGFLIAAGRRGDPLHEKAKSFLQGYSGGLVTVSAVIVETCFVFSGPGKVKLLDWAHSGGLGVADIPVSAYPELSRIIEKYADHDIDFTDAALIWLAEETGFRDILTVDQKDFSVFRLKGGKRFQLIEWF
jgi:predicted nucleic acid-binding protein